MRVLLVEDDQLLADSIKEELSHHYLVEVSSDGKEAEQKIYDNEYDLVVLDMNLPSKSGIEICKSVRAYGMKTPILVLTAEIMVDTKVAALDYGADDYLTKPFNMQELRARMRALLRRSRHVYAENILRVGDLRLDLSTCTVTRNGHEIKLRRKEMYILEYLMRNSGRVLTRDMILDQAWESSKEALTNTIDVHIKRLRDLIDKPFDHKLIKTIHGIGYKMDA